MAKPGGVTYCPSLSIRQRECSLFSDYDEPLVIGSGRKEGDRTKPNLNAVIEVDELAGWTTELDDEQIKLLYDSYFA